MVASVSSAQAVLPGGVAAKTVVFKKSFDLTADLIADQNVKLGTNKVGQTTVQLTVKNVGNNTTPAFKVSTVLRGSGGATPAIVSSIDNGMDGKGTAVIVATFSQNAVALVKTLMAVDIVVDSTNLVIEKNEANNKLAVALGKLPDAQKQLAQLVSKSAAQSVVVAKPVVPVNAVSNDFLKVQLPPTIVVLPVKPALEAPLDGAVVTSLTPQLSWVDKGPGSNYFRWYVQDVDTNNKVWERDFISRQKDDNRCNDALNHWLCSAVRVPAGILQYDKMYRWSVEAGSNDLTSGFAAPRQFVVKSEYVPVTFKTAPPVDTSPSTPTCTADQRTHWNGTECACPGVKTWDPVLLICSQGS